MGDEVSLRDYEKKLHFDEHYKKMQSWKAPQLIGTVVISIVQYALLYFLFRWIQANIPDVMFWNKSKVWFSYVSIQFTKIDVVYFCIGLCVQIYGMISLNRISLQNHSVRDKDDEKPSELLKNGYYAKARHPMYGVFALLQGGFLLSLHSLVSVIAAFAIIIFYYFHCIAEENKKLVPLFGEEYLDYRQDVTRVYITNEEFVMLDILTILSVIGIVM